jgi:hypothetical protein
MKTIAVLTTIVLAVRAAPISILRRADAPIPDAATIARLAPDLGATPPLNPTGFGDCEGPVTGSDGKPARVPCACPPTREAFIEVCDIIICRDEIVNKLLCSKGSYH